MRLVSRTTSSDPRQFGGWFSRPREFLNLLVSQEGSEPTSEALPQECDSAFQLSSYYARSEVALRTNTGTIAGHHLRPIARSSSNLM
ncbi:hypothetical protein KPH14_002282 [Odynerus spinipes]|uniref:Uncharacterized protein n=1 Tax=Odynerus spinipes TaxID=1348599 RepID=A0AAD9RMC2_9HYME|nr:hypothetical protein KPH14_002282 [Odynerus spinipes]